MHSSVARSTHLLFRLAFVFFLLFSFHPSFAANSNPIVVWNFNEGVGTTTYATIIVGTSTYTATGTVSNYYSAWVPSFSGGVSALEFHGQIGDGLTLPDNSFGYALPDSTRFGSLNFHIKLNNLNTDQVIFAADVKDASGKYEVLHVNKLGKLVLTWRNGYSSPQFEVVSTESLDTGTWHYVSIVRGLGSIAAVIVDSKPLTLTGATTNPAWFNEYLGNNVAYHVGLAKNRDFPGILNGAIDDLTYPYNTLSLVAPVVEVPVISDLLLPIITLSATKTSQTAANVAAIKWSTKNADFCDATGDWTKGNIGKKGTYYYTMPELSADFSIMCFSAFGISSASTSLTIIPPPPKIIVATQTPAVLPPPPPIAPPVQTLEELLSIPPVPVLRTEAVRVGDISYATEDTSGRLYLRWTTNISATSKLSFTVENNSTVFFAETDPIPSITHDARICVEPGKQVVVKVTAIDSQKQSHDTKEYRFTTPLQYSAKSIYTIAGSNSDEAKPSNTDVYLADTYIPPRISRLESSTPPELITGNVDSITRSGGVTEKKSFISSLALKIVVFVLLIMILALLGFKFSRRGFTFFGKANDSESRI